ncbi:Quinone oxidoreductase, partial [Geodia barretti]
RQADQVAYEGVLGSYAEYAVVPAHKLVPLPDGVNIHTAAAVLLQGMTAHYLTRDTYKASAGRYGADSRRGGRRGAPAHTMVKQSGATAIGTVSTDAKAALAREAGADEVILYTEKGFRSRNQAHYGRPRRRRCLRLRWKVHFRQEPGLPAPTRHVSAIRTGERGGRASRPATIELRRVVIRDPPVPRTPHADARGIAGTLERRVRHGGVRHAERCE